MISFIVPCYNDNQIVRRAIESLLHQSVEHEIILVDDGSDTPLENIWGSKVRLIRHPQNRGLSAALNTGVENSKYDRFAICSADDMLDESFSALTMGQSHKADIISTDFRGNNGRHVRSRGGDLQLLIKANCHGYAALIKKSIWKKVGGYKETMNPSWEDWEFFLNAAKNGATWYHIALPLHLYHRNPTGRDAEAQGKDFLLKGKMEGYHQDLYGNGKGVVTFVIPCYKHEGYLPDALNSIREQIYPHCNAVVIDDGSPNDNIHEVMKEFPEFELLRQENKHLSGARNSGIKLALKLYNSEYVVPLDADDKVSSIFVERAMGFMTPWKYVYTDIEFFGDAWHKYEVPDYDCEKMTKKHMHACTILMQSEMWKTIVKQRGYGYDESMKKGYEDWEFALACIKAGWCGSHLAEHLFYYRNHKDGSMRTEAQKINNELVTQVLKRQRWVTDKEKVRMGCSTCGKKRVFQVSQMGGVSQLIANIPTLGPVDAREQIEVTYKGPTTSTIKKIGRGLPGQGNVIYAYSGNPQNTYGPTFDVFAGDIHLFANGPFEFKRKVVEVVAEPAPIVSIPIPVSPVETQPLTPVKDVPNKTDQRIMSIIDNKDDLTVLNGVGPAKQIKLSEAGVSTYNDLVSRTAEEIALILGSTENLAEKIQREAETLV